MMEADTQVHLSSILSYLSYLSFFISLCPSSLLLTATYYLFNGLSYFYVSFSSCRKAFWGPRRRITRQVMCLLRSSLFALSLSVSYADRTGRDTRGFTRPLVLALDALPWGQDNSIFNVLRRVLLPVHLPSKGRNTTISLLHTLPSRRVSVFSPPPPCFPSVTHERLREGRQMKNAVNRERTSRGNLPSLTYYGSDLGSRFTIEADRLLLSGLPSSVLPTSTSLPATLAHFERNLSRRQLSRTSLSFSPTSPVFRSPSASSFSSSSISGRSSRVSIRTYRRRAPPAERPESMELHVESGAEFPHLEEESLKREKKQPKKQSTTEQFSSDEEGPAVADIEDERRLPDDVGTGDPTTPDPFWTPRAEEVTDDTSFGIARNARYEQKLEMPPPLVPPNGSGFHPEPVLPEHLYPHGMFDTEFLRTLWRNLRRYADTRAPRKETGATLVCPKGYEPELTELPAFKEKELEDGAADSTEPLGRAFTCTQTDSIPLEIRSGQPCPLGYSVSEFGTCEGQKHVGPSISCPLGFDLGGEQINPYVIRGKEYAKCGAVEYYKGKVWCPSGFVPLGLNLPNLPYGSSLDSFALIYSMKELMASSRPAPRNMQKIKSSIHVQLQKARLQQMAAELKKIFPRSFVDVLLTNSLQELNASASSSTVESKAHGNRSETTVDIVENSTRGHPMLGRERLPVDQHFSRGGELSADLPQRKTGMAGSLSTEMMSAGADTHDTKSKVEPLLEEEGIKWLTDFEEEKEDNHFEGAKERSGKGEGPSASLAQGFAQRETKQGASSPPLKCKLRTSTRMHGSTSHNKTAREFMKYSVQRNLQQGTNLPGEEISPIPDIYMKLQAKLPPGGGCAQVVAAFEAHCDKVECQTDYMHKMKTHIFNWLDYRLRSDTRQIDQLIPSGKDYRYTAPG